MLYNMLNLKEFIMWSSKEVVKPFPDPVVELVENDVRTFVEQELTTYKRNPDNQRLDDSVIVNIALFNLEALNYQNGVDQMNNLLSDHHNQIVEKRMKQLLHTLYIRYGIDIIDDLAERTLTTMVAVFNLKEPIIRTLDEKHNTFWLQPFIRLAYTNMMNDMETSVE